MAGMRLNLGLGLSSPTPPPIGEKEIALASELVEKLEFYKELVQTSGEVAEEVIGKIKQEIIEKGLDVPELFDNIETLLFILNQLKT